MEVTSREITYRQVIEQVFFNDDSELIIRTGWPEGQELDLDISTEWATDEPEWAKGLKPQELDKLTEKGQG